ncbi:unnamed protein product [Protopolystoma xenopodis]|uniref:Cadherin domain-containing protein n=1 Tax=Protopolystoma xenopodis TaxID=117903 RepID=A0A448WNY9_9PLAT|nr:unnamed protein product [Protopolystoma xenopodis]
MQKPSIYYIYFLNPSITFLRTWWQVRVEDENDNPPHLLSPLDVYVSIPEDQPVDSVLFEQTYLPPSSISLGIHELGQNQMNHLNSSCIRPLVVRARDDDFGRNGQLVYRLLESVPRLWPNDLVLTGSGLDHRVDLRSNVSDTFIHAGSWTTEIPGSQAVIGGKLKVFHPFAIDPATGAVRLSGKLDRERVPNYLLGVQVFFLTLWLISNFKIRK